MSYGKVRIGYTEFILPLDDAVAIVKPITKAEVVSSATVEGNWTSIIDTTTAFPTTTIEFVHEAFSDGDFRLINTL